MSFTTTTKRYVDPLTGNLMRSTTTMHDVGYTHKSSLWIEKRDDKTATVFFEFHSMRNEIKRWFEKRGYIVRSAGTFNRYKVAVDSATALMAQLTFGGSV